MTMPALFRWLLLISLATTLAAQTAWTTGRMNLPGVNTARSITYGNGRFVAAVGNTTTTNAIPGTAWSTDGTTWRVSTTKLPTDGSVLFAGGAFFCATDTALWRSTDGDTWQQVRTFIGHFHGFATNGRTILCLLDDGETIYGLYSPDLVTWRQTATIANGKFAGIKSVVACGGGVGPYFVRFSNSGGPVTVSTTDGTAWTNWSFLPSTFGLLAGGSGYVVGFTISPDGFGTIAFTGSSTGWSPSTLPGSLSTGNGIGYAGGRFFLLGSLTAAFRGDVWRALGTFSLNAGDSMNAVAYGGGRYVAVGQAGTGTAATDVVAGIAAGTTLPEITAQPVDRVVTAGSRATFSVTVDNADSSTVYQWYRNGFFIFGATNSSLTIDSVQSTDLGIYKLEVHNSIGYTLTSVPATLAYPSAPAIATSPVSRTVDAGAATLLSATATGVGTISYQWLRNGSPVAGATDSSLLLNSATASDAGSYTVTATTSGGSVTSAPATLTVRPSPPTIVASTAPTEPVIAGGRATFSVTLSGTTPFTIQWTHNNELIPGANSTTLVLDPATPYDAGDYRAFIFNSLGAASSPTFSLVVQPISRISNLSVLTSLSGPGDSFVLGFVVGGAGTSGLKPVVMRAVGPSLATLGVTGTLDDPLLQTFAGATKNGENDNWGGSAPLAVAFASVGAFPFAATSSRDAALLASLNSPDNSVKISAASSGSGLVLAEVYDASPSTSFTTATPRLLNVSVLKSIGTGLTVGFTIAGSSQKSVLIRAIGPTLADFGVTGALAESRLVLNASSGSQLTEGNQWGGTPELVSAFSSVGAFPLAAKSKDSAFIAKLPPGGYTAQVTGVGGTTGVALVEVYELP